MCDNLSVCRFGAHDANDSVSNTVNLLWERSISCNCPYGHEPCNEHFVIKLWDKSTDLIDSEIKNIVVTQKQKAEELLKHKKQDLITLAEALLKYETLDKEQVETVLKGEEIEPEKKEVDYSEMNFSTFGPYYYRYWWS